MKHLYDEESKSPKKKNEKDTSKLEKNSILWVGIIHNVKISMVVKEICSFNLILIKIHKKKENPNTCIKPEKKIFILSRQSWAERRGTGGIAFQASKIYYSTIVIGTTWYCHKTHVELWNSVEQFALW